MQLNNDKEGQKSSQLTSKLTQLSFSPEIIEQKEREFEDLVLWVTNIEGRINVIMKSNAYIRGDKDFNIKQFENVNSKNVICSFMTLLDAQCLDKQLHITGLTLIRKLVEVENKEMVTPSADWSGDEYAEYEEIIRAKQDNLVEIGCI